MNLHKDKIKEKVEKIMNILKENAILNIKEEQIKKILKGDAILKEKNLLDIFKENQITKEVEEKVKEILIENDPEEIEKIKELEDIKRLLTDKIKPILKLLEKDGKSWSKNKTKACMDTMKKITNITSQFSLAPGVSPDEWDRFLMVKGQLDEILIDHIRTKLFEETVDCCFAGHQEIAFKYPKVFYYLNGHFFEKIIYSMFFDSSLQNEKPMLIDKIVRDDGLMNECGYMVPNDLCEIFKRIDSFEMSLTSV